jgi:RimJ/RimL family protein N-acetyltransferase
MDAEKYINVMRTAFRSERLVYKALENNEADKKFLYEIQLDPITLGQGDVATFRPQRLEDATELVDYTKKNLISIKICIPKPLDNTDSQDTDKKATKDEDDYTPIGFMFLTGFDLKRSHNRSSMLGISILDKYTGKGYGTEAINWLVDWGFCHGNLHRISISCFSLNVRAAKLYEKIGFVLEGRGRECYWFNREWHDDLGFGMLVSDWEKLRGLDKVKS